VVGNWNPPTQVPSPWLWTPEAGVKFLGNLVDPSEHLNILTAARINASGQILAGAVDNLTGDHVAVILTPPAVSAWSPLGFGLAGASGVPSLSGSGSLVAGTSGAITLADAAPSAPAAMFLSSAVNPTPFKGGTLVTVPVALILPLATDAVGSVTVSWAAWPAGVPAGAELILQFAVADAGAVHGVALSNAIKGLTP